MSNTTTTTTAGGFAGDPAAALAVAGTSGCCGNSPQPGLALPEPVDQGQSPCCGTTAEAQEAGSCCGAEAKQEAVATGQGCCG
ncbi:hypothetical protein I4J89_34695 [Actinoplanes sp. NEAU-A11]|uniref:Uncharacterized protein n=2 Tax=Actinoplanes aureus TaxID=2792083 RepID=A0A931G1E1_9ACTN|nr:hypothetical protein [Actinoplanes aureus]